MAFKFVAFWVFRSAQPLGIQIRQRPFWRIFFQFCAKSGFHRDKFRQADNFIQFQQIGAYHTSWRFLTDCLCGKEIQIRGWKLDAVVQSHRQVPGRDFKTACHLLPRGAATQTGYLHLRHILTQPGCHVIQLHICGDPDHLAVFYTQPAAQRTFASAELNG